MSSLIPHVKRNIYSKILQFRSTCVNESFIMVKKTRTPFWTNHAFENQRLRLHLSRHFLSHPSSTHTAWLSHYLFFFHFIMILLELRKYLLMPFLSFFYSFLIIVLQLVPIINLSSISVFRFFFFLVCFLLFEKFINQVIWSTYWLISLSKIYWYLSLIIKAIIMKWTSYIEILSLKNIIFVQCTI